MYIYYFIILLFLLPYVVNLDSFMQLKRQNHATFTVKFIYHSTLQKQFRKR